MPDFWMNNFHLAFKKEDGSIIDIEEHGIKVRIINAKGINFSEDDIDYSYPHLMKEGIILVELAVCPLFE